MAASTDWNPARYGAFAEQRSQPFDDLLDMVEAEAFDSAVDMGCGSGELTMRLQQRWAINRVVGIDSSPAMLEAASAWASSSVRFESGDLSSWRLPPAGAVDLIVANASLQWVGDHRSVLAGWASMLRPGGQLAVQVPANADQPSHVAAARVAARQPFLEAFGAAGPPVDPVGVNVLVPAEYSRVLHDLGFVRQRVVMNVYPHVLADIDAVVEWVRGTTLTRFQRVLPEDLFEHFVTEYRRELATMLGDPSPCFFPFQRILMWGRLPG